MIWVSWRLQRTETVITAAIIALLAALLVPTGIIMANAYDRDGISACIRANGSDACGGVIRSFTSRFETVAGFTSWFTLVPGLIGVLLAASFVLELESGTYRLAWTQSITRRRWITTKLGTAIAAALVAALAMTLLITWWRAPFVRLEGRMENGAYDFEGTVAAGYALFALGLALAVGAVWRRTVPALVVAFVGYVAARIFVDTWLRQHFVAPISATWRELAGKGGPSGSPPAGLDHAWILNQYPSDRLGHHIDVKLGACFRAAGVHPGKVSCLVERAAVYSHVVYEPASRFWLFQGIETSLFGGIAVVLIGFAAWWTQSRR